MEKIDKLEIATMISLAVAFVASLISAILQLIVIVSS